MTAVIRPARKADIRTICELLSIFEDNQLPTEDAISRAIRRWENNIRDNPDYVLLVAEVADEVVGTAMLHRQHKLTKYGPGSHLEDLVVDSAHQHQGIGELILQEVATIATNWGCYKVIVTCSKSAKFFKKHGYEQSQIEMRLDIPEQLTEEEHHELMMLQERFNGSDLGWEDKP